MRWNIPKEHLVNHLVLGLEEEQVALPVEFQHLILGLRAYRWGTPKARLADYVDAASLAWWSATNGEASKFQLRAKPKGM